MATESHPSSGAGLREGEVRRPGSVCGRDGVGADVKGRLFKMWGRRTARERPGHILSHGLLSCLFFLLQPWNTDTGLSFLAEKSLVSYGPLYLTEPANNQATCCFSYTSSKIPLRLVKSYDRTSDLCYTLGVV